MKHVYTYAYIVNTPIMNIITMYIESVEHGSCSEDGTNQRHTRERRVSPRSEYISEYMCERERERSARERVYVQCDAGEYLVPSEQRGRLVQVRS